MIPTEARIVNYADLNLNNYGGGKVKGLSINEILQTDLLVIGGGLAGCWTALKAKQQGLDCIIVDKGYIGHTGCSRFASGDFKCMLPESDFNACMEKIVVSSGYLGHQEWIEAMLLESYDRVLELEAIGINFVRDNNGKILSTKDTLPELTISSAYLMPRFRKILRDMGVKLLDRIYVKELLLDKDDSVIGAIGLYTKTLEACKILSKATVLASGSCSLRASYFGHQFSTGDAYSLALKAGASLANMEAVNHNISFVDFDSTGGTFFRHNGAKFVNNKGEYFLEKYKGIPTGHAMAIEVKRTGGPIYIDIKDIKESDIDKAKNVMPWLKLMLERSKNGTSKYECIAAFAGSRATSAGIYITINGISEVDGLFATGDAGAMLGNGMGAMGVNLLNCSVFGSRCGIAAAEYCKNTAPPLTNSNEINYIEIEKPDKSGPTSETVLKKIQETILPMDVSIIRSESRLKAALNRIVEIKEEVLPKIIWNDAHSLVKKFETENMITYCEAMLKGAITRTESRVLHYREDYPMRDDKNWCKIILVKEKSNRLIVETIDLPEKAFKYIKPNGKGRDIYEQIQQNK